MVPSKRLVVTSSPFETRAALLEDGVVSELFLERQRRRSIVGNIYKARVRKVLPGMQSAFVDIGLEKDAFLYVSDVAGDNPAEERWDGADGEEEDAPQPTAASPAIEDLLREGQDLLVQVAKEPIAGKGARVTSHVTLPGRYVVYMPTVNHVGVSRRIEAEGERTRLKAVMQRLREELNCGFIVRTAGDGHPDEDLRDDATELASRWRSLLERSTSLRAPSLVHAEMGLLDKLLRDVVGDDVAEIVVDTVRDHERAVGELSRQQPDLAARVVLHTDATPAFEAYGIEAEIEKALRSKVWLKSGGYIVINQTEALVAIDVNTGRFVGKLNLEDTVLRTNLEAVREIVRQVRLRDLGGIVVLDFIDMEEPANRARLLEELENELKRDRSKSKILQISDFGLVEMTRKRVRGSLERLLSRACTRCSGTGRVKSPETVCYEIHREMLKARRSLVSGPVELRVHPEVAVALNGTERAVVEDLERELGLSIRLHEEPLFHPDQYEFMVP